MMFLASYRAPFRHLVDYAPFNFGEGGKVAGLKVVQVVQYVGAVIANLLLTCAGIIAVIGRCAVRAHDVCAVRAVCVVLVFHRCKG